MNFLHKYSLLFCTLWNNIFRTVGLNTQASTTQSHTIYSLTLLELYINLYNYSKKCIMKHYVTGLNFQLCYMNSVMRKRSFISTDSSECRICQRIYNVHGYSLRDIVQVMSLWLVLLEIILLDAILDKSYLD